MGCNLLHLEQKLSLVMESFKEMLVDASDEPTQSEVHEALLVPPGVLVLWTGNLQAGEPGALHDVAQLHADSAASVASARGDTEGQDLATLCEAVEDVYGLAA